MGVWEWGGGGGNGRYEGVENEVMGMNVVELKPYNNVAARAFLPFFSLQRSERR